MNFKVYHAENPTFGTTEIPFNEENYSKVAEVETTGLDEAFRLTNSIDHRWWENKEVKTFTAGPFRSTSVGDVIEKPDGRAYLCKMVSWEQIK